MFCVAQYPLTVQAPPEFNQFKSTEIFADISRMFYVFLVALVDIVLLDGIVKIETNPGWIVPVNCIFRIALLCLPILWTFGFLPTMDTLIEFLCESFLVYACGGSSTSSIRRLFFLLVTSSICIAGVFAALFFGSVQMAVLIAAGVGFYLAHGLPLDFIYSPCAFLCNGIHIVFSLALIGLGIAFHFLNIPLLCM